MVTQIQPWRRGSSPCPSATLAAESDPSFRPTDARTSAYRTGAPGPLASPALSAGAGHRCPPLPSPQAAAGTRTHLLGLALGSAIGHKSLGVLIPSAHRALGTRGLGVGLGERGERGTVPRGRRRLLRVEGAAVNRPPAQRGWQRCSRRRVRRRRAWFRLRSSHRSQRRRTPRGPRPQDRCPHRSWRPHQSRNRLPCSHRRRSAGASGGSSGGC